MTTDGKNDPQRRTSERIAEVRARFVAGLGDKAEALAALARQAGCEDRSAAAEAFDGLRLGLHNLAGGAPTLGLNDVGRVAADLERRLIAARLDDGGTSPETAAALASEIVRLPDAG